MIVRILDEGQYRLDSRFFDRLNELDDMLVAVVAGSGAGSGSFDTLFAQLLDVVRTNGEPLGESELVASDVVLPSPSMDQDDLRALFTGEGVVPG